MTGDAEPVVDETELLAAIGRMVVEAAVLEYAVARLVAVSEGLRGEALEERALGIVKLTGEAMHQFKALAKRRPALAWLMRDTTGLLRARHFVAHSIVQQDAIVEGQAALFVVHPRSGENMITTGMAVDNARMIREGRDRIEALIERELARSGPDPG
jgi:hypothetical protein